MATILYDVLMHTLLSLLRIASLFSPRLAYAFQSRNRTWPAIPAGQTVYWFHAASVGEYDTLRPLASRLLTDKPDAFLLFTVFSDSAMKQRSSDTLPHLLIPLPFDTRKNAIRFMRHFQPRAVFYSRYDIWPAFAREANARGIPQFLISAILPENSRRLKGISGVFLKAAYAGLKKIYAVNEATAERFRAAGLKNIEIAGDARADEIRSKMETLLQRPETSEKANRIFSLLKKSRITIVAGSTYESCEPMILDAIANQPDYSGILAPHHIDQKHLSWLKDYLDEKKIPHALYSDPYAKPERIVIADTLGVLPALYKTGDIAFVGGGFEGKIHNVLEPALHGLPVLSGPAFRNSHEAIEMHERGFLFSLEYARPETFAKAVIEHSGKRDEIAGFFESVTGATEKIYNDLRLWL